MTLAVVTGAARGIGRAIAAGLTGDGYEVVTVDRAGADVLADLADTRALAELVDGVRREHGPIGVLVNNAGTARLEHFNEITVDSWRHVMVVNCDAPFFLSQRTAEHMIADGVEGRMDGGVLADQMPRRRFMPPYRNSVSWPRELSDRALNRNSVS
ncbi:SDR family NAD(P)-dependent oxidoreductase [Nonomuraea dietziae]|uniref:NAD(P)-dependent dehydrogenase (Short-subunit alcohol dehydrogenase family) n=1 Tax=Nonomuraea dietziae TaxID=65515 RepID=A0A7W5YQ13_9ACTN|nr:SDR family oxidoreductase [Nonomuraea dietziae]MBB3725784.1 NAD(P)-dependent dehydrogenase (short-subunit alcohol dehydrogenase family) [Nonomuraea dietziae]